MSERIAVMASSGGRRIPISLRHVATQRLASCSASDTTGGHWVSTDKSDRALAFGLLSLLVGLGVPRGAWIGYALDVILLLLVLTIVNRARRALQEAARQR